MQLEQGQARHSHTPAAPLQTTTGWPVLVLWAADCTACCAAADAADVCIMLLFLQLCSCLIQLLLQLRPCCCTALLLLRILIPVLLLLVLLHWGVRSIITS
jgi:hypothetical protein